MMRLLVCLPWTIAMALHSSSWNEAEKPPKKRVFGAEHRNCRAGAKSRTDLDIVGGRVVDDPNRYPFLAWVGDKDGTGMAQFCGGSLVHPRIVMTAAHCVYSHDTLNAGIYVRFHVTNFAQKKGIERDVINWRKHKNFSPSTLSNDIALFLLDEEVTPEEVQPVVMSDGKESTDGETNATILGWGSTDEECRIYDTYLRDSQVPIGSSGGSCKTPGSKVLTVKDIDSGSQICAGHYSKDAMEYPGCGDSGGPLLTYNATGDSFIQVGFVSWSYGVPYPDVFTRVSAYRDWIDRETDRLIEEGEHEVVRAIRGKQRAKSANPEAVNGTDSPYAPTVA